MTKNTLNLATLAAAGALLALPATGLAKKPENPGHGKPAKSQKNKNSCLKKTHKVGYMVKGTLVSATADDAATPLVNEATFTIKVTGGNHHAKVSGEIADQDLAKKGVQIDGATYVVAATDTFELKLDGYEAPDTPSPGDSVKVKGKIAVTKKHCAAAGTSTADRYAKPDITKVTITDMDPDPVPAPPVA